MLHVHALRQGTSDAMAFSSILEQRWLEHGSLLVSRDKEAGRNGRGPDSLHHMSVKSKNVRSTE